MPYAGWLVFEDVQTLEEGTSVEKLPPSAWPMGMSVEHCLDGESTQGTASPL